MANYKPLVASIVNSNLIDANGGRLLKTVNTSNWNLAFIYGTALAKSIAASVNATGGVIKVSHTIVLPSGTVLGWYGTNSAQQSAGNANVQTFADNHGRYGVTVNTPTDGMIFRFYSHG